MELNIGNQIKRLRRERDITQEEFASVLGVSYQSVSRWENNTCYPDIELLPTIADFFGISIDRLMGVDEAAEKSKAAQYTSRFQDAVSQGRIDDCISIARNGVAEYPNNYELLNRLMYVLFLSGDSDGNIPEWQENMQKYDSEITMLGERIMKYCPDQNIRLEAVGRLEHFAKLCGISGLLQRILMVFAMRKDSRIFSGHCQLKTASRFSKR